MPKAGEAVWPRCSATPAAGRSVMSAQWASGRRPFSGPAALPVTWFRRTRHIGTRSGRATPPPPPGIDPAAPQAVARSSRQAAPSPAKRILCNAVPPIKVAPRPCGSRLRGTAGRGPQSGCPTPHPGPARPLASAAPPRSALECFTGHPARVPRQYCRQTLRQGR